MVPTPRIPEREAALKDLAKSLGVSGQDMTDAQRKAFTEGRKSIDARWPVPRANIEDFMKHMLHALALVGPRRLLAAGYSATDINKIWGGNALRVLKTTEAVRDRLQTRKGD